jgi:hypothetical protein
MKKKEKVLTGAGGEALRGAALVPGAAAASTLGLFLLPTGRPGHRFTDADDKATIEASFGLFLLPWGRLRPCFSISTPASRLAPPASAIEKLRLVEGKTLDEMWRKKTMQLRKLVMKGLGFFPNRRTLFISNFSWALASYRSKQIYRLLHFAPSRK